MKRNDWLEVLSRLAVGPITEIDFASRVPASLRVAVPTGASVTGEEGTIDAASFAFTPPPSAQLWPIAAGNGARFGVRLRTARADVGPVAARLAAAAIERGVSPVILSYVDRSGFEQLGFRVERVHGQSSAEREMQEAELCRFWDLSIVVNVEDVAQLS